MPDNLVILHDGPIEAESHYSIPRQPVPPLLAIEHVSPKSRRKDNETNREKYEGMKILYCLMFHLGIEEITLFRLRRGRYASVVPNDAGRYPIPELEIEVGLHEGWMRYWFRGELVPLPPELSASLAQTRREPVVVQGALAVTQGALATTQVELATTQGALAAARDTLTLTEEQLREAQEQRERDAALIADLRRRLGEPD